MIPNIIHHVWPGNDEFREKFRPWRESWVRHNPDWTLLFWRLTDPITRHIDDGEVQQVLDMSELSVVVKSDVLRLYALHKYGGVYTDTDIECTQTLKTLLDAEFFCGMADDRYACVSLMGSRPGHPLVAGMLREGIANIRSRGIAACNLAPNKICGPAMLTEKVVWQGGTANCPKKSRDDVTLHPAQFFHQQEPWAIYTRNYYNGGTRDGWAANGNIVTILSDGRRRPGA